MYSGLYHRWWLTVALVALLSGMSLGFDVSPKSEVPPTPAEASRTYFQRVSQIIDQMAKRTERDLSSQTLAKSVLHLHGAAVDIDQVPTEYVDRDLVQWATQIRGQLDQAVNECKLTQKEMVFRLKSSQAGHENVTDSKRSELRKEADNRIRQTIARALKNVQQMESEAQSKMTQRYQIQF